jgi:hypothetical protein
MYMVTLFVLLTGTAQCVCATHPVPSTTVTNSQKNPVELKPIEQIKIYRRGNLTLKLHSLCNKLNDLSIFRDRKEILNIKKGDASFIRLIFPYIGVREKTERTLNGDLFDFISAKSAQSKDPFIEIDGQGTPGIIIVRGYLCNPSCRFEVYSLGQRAREIGRMEDSYGEVQFLDVDHDGKYEAFARDSTFVTWDKCSNQLVLPMIIMRINDSGLTVATDLMRMAPLSRQRQKELITRWSFEKGSPDRLEKNEFYLSSVVLGDILTLIYSGNSKTAFKAIDEFWEPKTFAVNAGRHTSKAEFEKALLRQLSLSPFLTAVQKLNPHDERITSLRPGLAIKEHQTILIQSDCSK